MKYDVVIGLEIHLQVRTDSKMFCRCPNRYGAPPNTLVCPVCMGYPGVLPVPNQEAIHKTLMAGMMCGCQIATYSKFDRKSYFYPDMPKNYQLSQYDLPFCGPGKLRIGGKSLSGTVAPRDIRITRIHLEEDVAKSTHFTRSSGIDFNRAGVPLMETVTEPDMHSPDEAYLYLVTLKRVMEYADISDCDMEKGQLRCDVNVSLKSAGATELNPKTELKNLNSFKAVHRALEYEIERQTGVLDAGGELRQETRGWNDEQGETYVLRVKEYAHDYRYFPDPDLMPIVITEAELDEIRQNLPESPFARQERFSRDFSLPEYDVAVLTHDRHCADYFEACIAAGGKPKLLSNWIMTEMLGELSRAHLTFSQCPVSPEQLTALVGLVEQGTISGRSAKVVFADMFQTGRDPEDIVREKNLRQENDSEVVRTFVQQAIGENPGPVQQYREGKEQALNFLVGQVMRFSRGKANPKQAAELLRRELGME